MTLTLGCAVKNHMVQWYILVIMRKEEYLWFPTGKKKKDFLHTTGKTPKRTSRAKPEASDHLVTSSFTGPFQKSHTSPDVKFHKTASLTSLLKLAMQREQMECYCHKLIGLRAVSYLFLQHHDTLSLISRQQGNLLISKA